MSVPLTIYSMAEAAERPHRLRVRERAQWAAEAEAARPPRPNVVRAAALRVTGVVTRTWAQSFPRRQAARVDASAVGPGLA
jgi:hypothetical protein